MITDSTAVYGKVVNTIGAVLDELGKRFGATGAHLWSVMVRQVYVDAIRDGITVLVLWALCVVTFRYVTPRWKRWMDDDEVFSLVSIGVFVVFLTIFTSFATADAINSVSQLANPEYGALQNVMSMVMPSHR